MTFYVVLVGCLVKELTSGKRDVRPLSLLVMSGRERSKKTLSLACVCFSRLCLLSFDDDDDDDMMMMILVGPSLRFFDTLDDFNNRVAVVCLRWKMHPITSTDAITRQADSLPIFPSAPSVFMDDLYEVVLWRKLEREASIWNFGLSIWNILRF
jgi:hypothetical protein